VKQGKTEVDVFAHWHPVLLSADLDSKPRTIVLHGRNLVLFRTQSGGVGAIQEECPHRRMNLARGKVCGERLVCAYHGWEFSVEGKGSSPGNPKLSIKAEVFHAQEREGAIWISSSGDISTFPEISVDGFEYITTQYYRVRAPMELVLDNFTEVEHTGTTHAMLGYDNARMGEVTVEVQTGEDTVRVVNRGPQKFLPWIVERVFRIRTGDIFVDDWVTCFQPVYTQYEHWWEDPETGKSRDEHLRTFVFFVPEDDGTTHLFVLAYARSGRGAGFVRKFLLFPLMERLLRLEIGLDVDMIEGLANKEPHLEGMRLSRFDRVLVLNRRFLESHYRALAKKVPESQSLGA